MTLFNFLRKKEPKNDLDTLFQRGVKEPEYRIKFLQSLLSENLIVLIQQGTNIQAFPVRTGNAVVYVFELDDGRIPIFTGANRLFEKNIVDRRVDYYELNARTLFENSKGKTFILNPNSDIQKEFAPDEIERLLNGTYFDNTVYIKQIEESINVRIKQPPVYPEQAVAALTNLFLDRPNVKSCYVAWIDNPTMSEPPHYIFAIDVTEGWETVCKEVGFLVRQILGEGIFAEMIQLKGVEGIGNYFINNSQPFYKSNR